MSDYRPDEPEFGCPTCGGADCRCEAAVSQWGTYENDTEGLHIVDGASDRIICRGVIDAERARLLEAAPDLFAALTEALPYLLGDHHPVTVTQEYGEFLDRVEAAIERAKGGAA